MTTIFKYIAIICGICFWGIQAEAKIVSVEVTGYGANHKLAVIEGLKEAIAQVSGISVNAVDTMSLSSIVAEQTNDDKTSSKQHFSKETQSGILTQVNGYVSGYQVVSSIKDDDGTYQVEMIVEIEKYEVPGQDNNRRGIAVLGFKAEKAFCMGTSLTADKQIESVTDALVNALTATRKFSVLDRDNEDVYNLEKSLVLSEDAKRSEIAKLGNVKGTDYIVTGTVKSLSINSNKQKIALTGDTFTTYSASVSIDFKLLAFATRQVKFASSVRVSLGNSEISGKKCQDILLLLMQKAASQIVDKCIENIYPPLIVNVKGNNVYLNIGGENIKKGSLYAVYSVGEKIIDPYTGESLGAEETQIATLRISEVKPKYSVGTLESGEITDIKKGQICRSFTPAPKASAKSKKTIKKKISEDEW